MNELDIEKCLAIKEYVAFLKKEGIIIDYDENLGDSFATSNMKISMTPEMMEKHLPDNIKKLIMESLDPDTLPQC